MLALIVSERLGSVKQLEKYDSYTPDIHLMCDLRAVLIKTFRGLIPVSSHSLRCQLNLLVALIYCLAKPKVCDLDFPKMEDDVLRLQIVVDDLLLLFIQILEPTQNLRNYELSLLLRDLSILLQVKVEVRARTKFQNCAEAVVINLDSVKLFDYSPVVQVLVDLVLSYCMLYVIVFDLL